MKRNLPCFNAPGNTVVYAMTSNMPSAQTNVGTGTSSNTFQVTFPTAASSAELVTSRMPERKVPPITTQMVSPSATSNTTASTALPSELPKASKDQTTAIIAIAVSVSVVAVICLVVIYKLKLSGQLRSNWVISISGKTIKRKAPVAYNPSIASTHKLHDNSYDARDDGIIERESFPPKNAIGNIYHKQPDSYEVPMQGSHTSRLTVLDSAYLEADDCVTSSCEGDLDENVSLPGILSKDTSLPLSEPQYEVLDCKFNSSLYVNADCTRKFPSAACEYSNHRSYKAPVDGSKRTGIKVDHADLYQTW